MLWKAVHLGVVGRQGLLVAGLHDGDVGARLRAEEVGAAQPGLRSIRLLAAPEAARHRAHQPPHVRARVRGAHNLCNTDTLLMRNCGKVAHVTAGSVDQAG